MKLKLYMLGLYILNAKIVPDFQTISPDVHVCVVILDLIMMKFSRRNKYQLMMKSHLRDGTQLAVFIPEVAMQHDVFASAITSALIWRS